MDSSNALLEMRNISKSFGVVHALQNVSFSLLSGEVHALVGENGAGKSTLMNILSGGLTYFDGEILLNGHPVELRTPINAFRLGIAKIHQELQLVPYMTVAQNIFMGREKRNLVFMNDSAMNREAEKLLKDLEIHVQPTALIKDLRIGEQQMVEIAKALSLDSKILIMDEPTSAISKAETNQLFKIIRRLRSKGAGIIYITHRMEEVYEISDRLTIMRDGVRIGTYDTKDCSEEFVISKMVGRNIQDLFKKSSVATDKVALNVNHLNFTPLNDSFKRALKDISLTIHEGEVVGIAGLMGSGRSEFCECLFGLHGSSMTGEISLAGEVVRLKTPEAAIRHGISFATEDRKAQGLVLQRSIGENMSLPLLRKFSKLGFMTTRSEKMLWNQEKQHLSIKAPSCLVLASTLSGGNQQKVILGRWLMTKPRVLILDEPTRGIDVGAKSEIYRLIDDLALQGLAILVVSSDMPELMGLSDRIITFCEGRVTGEFARGKATQEQLLWAATRTEGRSNANAIEQQ